MQTAMRDMTGGSNIEWLTLGREFNTAQFTGTLTHTNLMNGHRDGTVLGVTTVEDNVAITNYIQLPHTESINEWMNKEVTLSAVVETRRLQHTEEDTYLHTAKSWSIRLA